MLRTPRKRRYLTAQNAPRRDVVRHYRIVHERRPFITLRTNGNWLAMNFAFFVSYFIKRERS